MSRLHTGSVTRPRFESRPYRLHPSRREHIHGRIRPMVDEPGMGGPIGLAVLLIATVFIGFIIAKPHHAASVASLPHSAAGSHVPLNDARGDK